MLHAAWETAYGLILSRDILGERGRQRCQQILLAPLDVGRASVRTPSLAEHAIDLARRGLVEFKVPAVERKDEQGHR
jgi:hypothetical protein